MRSLWHAATPGLRAPLRIVCLPGAYQTPQNFIDAGFVDAARHLHADLEFVDLELLELTDRSARERLHAEVLAPARAAGCRRLWLAGVSLGGWVALDLARHYPGDCSALMLIAPYLGNRALIRELGAAADGGGRDGASTVTAADDEEREIWRWLDSRDGESPPLHLGYGSRDRFRAAHELLARRLPPQRVAMLPGGHDWPTFTALWRHMLASGIA